MLNEAPNASPYLIPRYGLAVQNHQIFADIQMKTMRGDEPNRGNRTIDSHVFGKSGTL